MTTTTNTQVSDHIARTLLASDATQSYKRYAASNGVNLVDSSHDLPCGSHLERVCISPMGLCRYEWRLYSPLGVIVENHAPTPIGFHQGRYSDLMAETLRRYQACKAEGGWEAGELFVQVWCAGTRPTQEAIDAHRARAAAMRF